MRQIICIAGLILCISQSVVWADEAVENEMKNDILLRALVDELERGRVGLKLEDLEEPYFIEYALLDSSGASVSAQLGAVTSRYEDRSRSLRTDVRVGSYELDNTNFSGDYGSYRRGGMRGASIPIEDDYQAIRQAIWWATDRDYKSVIETLESKKAFMKTKLIEDKPDDFSRESPTVYFEDRIDVSIDVDQLEQMVLDLSRIFRGFPDVQSSSVSMSAGGGNKYLINTEGSRLRVSSMRYVLSIGATVQAADGMKLSDSISVHARKLEDVPELEELTERTRAMVGKLLAVKEAPTLESYTGPVLFEAEAAAAIFSRTFASRFAGGQRPVGGRTDPDDFENKLSKRILPRFLNVVDDPTLEVVAGEPVIGHYTYDDQGVKARPVTLVEQGRLKTLLMSRNPSKELKQSNGHGRGVYQPRASAGCLIVSADDADDTDSLKEQLLEACADEDLEFGIRIASLGSAGGERYSRYRGMIGGGTTPLAMYKVYPDDREELVRGAEIARIDLKAFKRILAIGDTPYVMNGGGRTEGSTIVAPAMLFEELDLAKIDQDFDKPPILPTPLARQVPQ
jgi:TldD protein